MNYASQQDIVDRYSENLLLLIADRDHDGTPDPAAIDRALADAANITDAHIGERYQLPLVEIPALLIGLNVDIAIYKLAASADVATDQQRDRYNDALKLLGKISNGTLSLGVATKKTPASKGHGVSLKGPGRLFGRDQVRNW